MRGFYIYCIRRNVDNGKISTRDEFVLGRKAKGVDFGNGVQAIPFKDIEAVVSEIDLSRFGAQAIKDKLQKDARWTEKNVKRHHQVIAKANKTETAIPMKFGMIFKTKKSLEAMLKKYYEKFKKLLYCFKDKQEWGLKGYLEYKKFVEIIKNKNKEIQKLERRRSSIPEGMKWYLDRKIDEIITSQVEREIEEELRRIIDKLEKQADEIRLNDLLPKEVGVPGKDMILNAACLVRNEVLDKFKKMTQEMAPEGEARGIALILTGPWPPYNFVPKSLTSDSE